MSPMTVSLPMCSVNFMDTTLSVEEQAVADRIAELKAEAGRGFAHPRTPLPA